MGKNNDSNSVDYYGQANFGEYSQCFPYFPSDKISSYFDFESAKNPSVFMKDNIYHLYFNSYIGDDCKISFLTSENLDDWDNFNTLPNSENCLYPSVFENEGSYYLLYSKNGSIYFRLSNDMVIWNDEELLYQNDNQLSCPSLVFYRHKFILFFNELNGIYSVESEDLMNWSNHRLEIDNVFNPCVILDSYDNYKTMYLYYNKYDGDDIEICFSICHDRVWISYRNGWIQSDTFSNIECTKFGNDIKFTLSMSHFNKNVDNLNLDDVDIMFSFSNNHTTNWYKRRSNYVYLKNDSGDEGEFNYDDLSDVSFTPSHKFNYKKAANSIYYSLTVYQYSKDGIYWHSVLQDDDKYYRVSVDGGLTYGERVSLGR